MSEQETPKRTKSNATSSTSASGDPKANQAAAHWRANIRVVLSLLFVWFLVSFGFGILLVDQLNQIQFYGFELGFWWAQQGSIYVFVVPIFVYAWLMHRIDRKYGVSDSPQADED